MRRWTILGLAFLSSCMDWKEHHEMDTVGLTEEELKAPPGSNEVRARIINDVRTWRRLREHLDEGKPDCTAVKAEKEGPRCAADDEAFELIRFPGDPPEKPDRVEETAYYCPKESVYYYHYVGGRERLDVWLGPYKVTWNRGG